MLICRVRLHNTRNALMFRMSVEQIRLQVPPKLGGMCLEYWTICYVQLQWVCQLYAVPCWSVC